MIRRIIPLLLVTALASAGAPESARVAVLANADEPDSVALARKYAKARGIPEGNIVALSLPTAEQVSWDEFVTRVRNPLLKELVSRRLLEGTTEEKPDAEGRIRLHVTKNGVDFLVLCRGVPLKIANDPARFEAREKSLKLQAEFRVNYAAVDSELAVLPRPDTPLAGFIPSPWYNTDEPSPTLTRDTLRVARLDGPSASAASRLVDNAVEAEKNGLLGRAYIDKGGPHARGEEWLTLVDKLCRGAAFDTTTDTAPALIPAGARFDAPALHFGWYAPDLAGAPAEPGFRYPPGAIAIHIHSFSARTLRDPKAGWTGPLVARGVTATVGNVEEPYLELTHNPALFLRALLLGKTAGEAAACSCPALSWQTIFVGDPLYRPFARDVPAQLADIGKRTDPALAYAVIRAVRRLDDKNASAEADKLLAQAFTKLPVLALAREILEREAKSGKSLSFRADALAPVAEDAGLVLETAEKLLSVGKSSEALKLLENQSVLGVKPGPRAAEIARAHGKTALAAKLADAGRS